MANSEDENENLSLQMALQLSLLQDSTVATIDSHDEELSMALQMSILSSSLENTTIVPSKAPRVDIESELFPVDTVLTLVLCLQDCVNDEYITRLDNLSTSMSTFVDTLSDLEARINSVVAEVEANLSISILDRQASETAQVCLMDEITTIEAAREQVLEDEANLNKDAEDCQQKLIESKVRLNQTESVVTNTKKTAAILPVASSVLTVPFLFVPGGAIVTLGAAAAGLTNVVSSVRTSRRISERADGQLEDAQNEVKDREAALEEARNLKDALEIDKKYVEYAAHWKDFEASQFLDDQDCHRESRLALARSVEALRHLQSRLVSVQDHADNLDKTLSRAIRREERGAFNSSTNHVIPEMVAQVVKSLRHFFEVCSPKPETDLQKLEIDQLMNCLDEMYAKFLSQGRIAIESQ